jgi:hypothetical protein
LNALENARALLIETGAGGAKLAAVRIDRVKVLVKMERFGEACVALLEVEDDNALELRCEAIEGRQRLFEQEAVKAMNLAGGLNAKQQAAKEAEIHAMSVLPDDLRFLYERGCDLFPVIQCRYVGALFESVNCKKHVNRLMELIVAAIERMKENPHPEDWRGIFAFFKRNHFSFVFFRSS